MKLRLQVHENIRATRDKYTLKQWLAIKSYLQKILKGIVYWKKKDGLNHENTGKKTFHNRSGWTGRTKKKFAMSNTIINKFLILVEDNIKEQATT